MENAAPEKRKKENESDGNDSGFVSKIKKRKRMEAGDE